MVNNYSSPYGTNPQEMAEKFMEIHGSDLRALNESKIRGWFLHVEEVARSKVHKEYEDGHRGACSTCEFVAEKNRHLSHCLEQVKKASKALAMWVKEANL